MHLNLQGKRAVVCGSSQGIGWASAVALADLGAQLVLLARDAERLERRCGELPRGAHQQHSFAVADFADVKQVQRAAAEIVRLHGPIQILVNNTGGPPPGSVFDAQVEQFQTAATCHLLANHVLVQAFVPGMKESGYGRVINIVSTSVKQPIPGLGVSNTIRGAVASWAKTLSAELGPFNITVNNVLPGFTETSRLAALIATKAQQNGVAPESIADSMRNEVPLRRFAKPEEVAGVVAFLATPAASYISGVSLPVDGGRTSCL